MITNTTRRFWHVLLSSLAFLVRYRYFKKWFWVPLLIILIGFLLPQNMIIPVQGASTKDWDDNSFWAYPWGSSITHKGIDIFAKKGTPIIAATNGLVIYTYEGGKGGKSVMVLGPKWRIHYYAHLDEIKTKSFRFVNQKKQIGTVGDSGNAKGKAPHLHYSIVSLIPLPWRIDRSHQGWKKMFYLNPIKYLNKAN